MDQFGLGGRGPNMETVKVSFHHFPLSEAIALCILFTVYCLELSP